MQLIEDNERPRVFFVYPYQDSEKLKPIFRHACSKAEVRPVFADEEIQFGENLLQKLQFLIVSSDLIVVVLTEPISYGVNFEIEYSMATKKPIIIFVPRKMIFLYDIQPFRLNKYDSRNDLLQLLSSTLHKLKYQLKRRLYTEKKAELKTIFNFLKNSLEKNVLVLGKDSSSDGLMKMKHISDVASSRGYVPVLLKEMPEIKHLTLEEKMIRMGALCRFIIAEDSRASGHIDEVRLCAECQYVTATVREVGSASSWMQAHYPFTFNFINRFCYTTQKKNGLNDPMCENISESIETATEEAIEWAEKLINQRKKYFSGKIYDNF